MSRAAATNTDLGHHQFESDPVVALAGGDDPRDRAAAAVGSEVNRGGQATTKAPQRLTVGTRAGFLVIRPTAPCVSLGA